MPPLATLKSFLRPAAEFIRQVTIRGTISSRAVFDAEIRPHQPVERMNVFVSSICTAKCVFCPQDRHEDPKAVMGNDLFFKVADQFAAAGGSHLIFSPNNGDPLVDRFLANKLRYASELGIRQIMVVTNGILLTRSDIIDVLLTCATDIRISLPGLDSETYRRVYRVDKAAEAQAGILALAQRKRDLGSRADISLSLRLDRPLDDVLAEAAFRPLDPYLADGTITIPESEIVSEDMDNWSGAIRAEDLPGLMTLKTFTLPPGRRPCRRLFWDIAVLADGKMRMCGCRYLRSNYDDLVVGDLTDHSLADLFLGEAHHALLKRVASGDWPTVCNNCSFYEPINYSWSAYASMAWATVLNHLRRLRPGAGKGISA